MSRINTPASIEAAPAAAQPLLEAVKKQIGSVPNLFRVVANSPAALEGLLGLNGALAKGSLDSKTRERIAIAVAEINGCGYCLSAHSYIGKNVAKLDDAEITANRSGASNDLKANAAVRFAAKVVNARGCGLLRPEEGRHSADGLLLSRHRQVWRPATAPGMRRRMARPAPEIAASYRTHACDRAICPRLASQDHAESIAYADRAKLEAVLAGPAPVAPP
jgi:AhpD family alkylhydroperoxidase